MKNVQQTHSFSLKPCIHYLTSNAFQHHFKPSPNVYATSQDEHSSTIIGIYSLKCSNFGTLFVELKKKKVQIPINLTYKMQFQLTQKRKRKIHQIHMILQFKFKNLEFRDLLTQIQKLSFELQARNQVEVTLKL